MQFYRKCLKLRKESRTLLWGDYREYLPRHRQIYFYARVFQSIHYIVICNFSDRNVTLKMPRAYADKKLYPVLCNYAMTEDAARQETLSMWPYEARVYRCRSRIKGSEQ